MTGVGVPIDGRRFNLTRGARRFSLAFAIAFIGVLAQLAGSAQGQGPACTISWVGDVNDNWYGTGANGTNWTSDRIPNDQDFACLDNQASPYTVRIAGSGLGGHTTNGFRIESDVTVVLDSGGTQPVSLTAREQPATNAGTIRMSGPSFLGTASLTNTGTISIPAGGYQLPGNSTYERRIWGDVLNRGTISVGSPVASIGGRRSAAGVFYDGGPVETITNEGTIEVANGGKLKVFRAILKQTDTGLIRGPGEVNVTGATSESGTCQENSNNGAPGTLRIEGGSLAPGADVDVQFCTELRFVSADDATGEIGVSPYVVSAGGSVGGQPTLYGDIPAGITLNIDSVGLNTISRDSFGATVFLAENVTNRGSINLNGPGAWLRQRTDLAPGFTLTNRGTITVTAGGGPGPRTLGVTNIDNYGTVSIQHPDAALRGGLNNYETGSTSGGTNYYESPPTSASTPIALTNRGELNVASGGALTVGYGSHFDNAWPVSLVHEDGGVVRGGGSVKVYGQKSTLQFSGGSSDIPTLMTRNADLAFSSEAGSSGHVDVAVDLAFGSGTNTQVTGTVPAGVSIDVESTLDRFGSQSSAQLAAAADWRNESTIRLINGGATIDTAFPGTFTNAGTVITDGSVGQPSRLLFGNTTNHGLIDVASPHNLIAGTISNASAGKIRVAAGAQASGTWNNAGTIELAGTMSGSLTQTAGSTELSGGPSPALNAAVTLQGGVIRGSGSIGNFVNNSGGTISPGIGGPGTLNIFDYTQNAGGTYAVDLTGTSPGSEFDQLVITNRVALNGTLAVDTTGFTPQQSDRFRIIDAPTPPQAPTRTGQFSNVSQTGYQHGVIYNPTNVELGFLPECSDGRDNDSDGLTDFPADNGCISAIDNSESTECSDNVDNDGDGRVDYPADTGCISRADDSENTEENPECSDQIDNDGNGQVDFPNDGGCESATDDDESDPAPDYFPPADQAVEEDQSQYIDLGYFTDPGSGSPWQMTVDWGDGSAPESFDWFPDFGVGLNHTYADQGEYEVTVTVTEGDQNPDSDSGTFTVNVTADRPECSDERDNDNDGEIDFPDDPGCISADDNSEATDSNPECSDERDNDDDGDIDFPDDSGCTDPNDDTEESNIATLRGPIVTEGDSGTTDAVFTITLSEPAKEGASVVFDSYGYSADAGFDFIPVSQVVTFAEGEQSAEVRVPVIGDTIDEGTEQFYGYLTDGNRVTFDFANESQFAFATIIDNDGGNEAPAAASDYYTTPEGETLSVEAPGVLANDEDLEDDPLTASLWFSPSNGTLTLNSDGSFTYVPNPGYRGTDIFGYNACDSTSCSPVAYVYITVGPVEDDEPVATGDSATTDEDTATDVDVLANDTGDDLTISNVSDPANGTAEVVGGEIRYTPDANFNGTDTFTYRACNDANPPECSEPATVTMTVSAVNDAPEADDDTAETDEDTSRLIDVLANDSDVEPGTLTITDLSDPANGTVQVRQGGQVRYTPDPNFSGSDSFTYRASDGDASSAPATVRITVRAVNDAPDANADSASTNEDTSRLVDVLANDTDVDSGALTISNVSDPANGTAEVQGGQVRYTPDPDFNGTDTFTYRACDNGTPSQCSGPATVTITVGAVNDAPDAEDDSYATDEDEDLSVGAPGVLENDSDAEDDSLTAVLVDGPANGDLDLNEDGSFTYTPDPDFNGNDSFTYRANDGVDSSDVTTVRITVGSVNDTPEADDDSYSTDEDEELSVNAPGVLAGDTDAEDDSLTAELVTGPANGDLDLDPDGSFAYTPDPDFNGEDTFTYRACDDANPPECSDPATVTITVNAVNDTPEADDDSYATDEDTELSVAAPGVLAGDTDADDDTLTASLVTGPANGDLDLNADGSFSYTPDANFSGEDSFTYRASDGDEDSEIATVTITVRAVNDAPDADADSATTDEDNSVLVDVLGNDSDVDSNQLTISNVSDPSNGTAVVEQGEVRYTPDPDFNGEDTFTYRACDDANPPACSEPTTVTITVNPADETTECSDNADNDSDGNIDFPADQGCDSADDISESPDPPECSDRIDNDSDGTTNFPADQGCDSLQDNSEAPDPPECNDRLDNDNDGTVNFPADQGCDSNQDDSESPDAPECSDRLDNDGDGKQNFPADQGCNSADDDSEAPDAPQCSDRLDNDSDGTTNFPADQGCDSNQDDSEAPDPPQCNDRLDNDSDGQNNFPADQGCSSNDDNSESPDPPQCSDRLDNDGDGKTNFPADQGCDSANDNSEAPDPPQCSDRLDNDNDGTTNFPADLGCDSANDNSESPDPPQCNDRADNDGDGKNNYPADQGCSSATDNSESPDPPQCNDRIDNDGDGKNNYPADPGCSSATDNSEANEPPQCSDGKDNDGDGKKDYPADQGCDSANDNSESPDPPQCSDRLDNDGDGKTNFPADQGCDSANDNSEPPTRRSARTAWTTTATARRTSPRTPGARRPLTTPSHRTRRNARTAATTTPTARSTTRQT